MEPIHGPEAVDGPVGSPPVQAPTPTTQPAVGVRDPDRPASRTAADPPAVRARRRDPIERMQSLLDRAGGPGLLFDGDRAHAADRAIRVSANEDASPLWIIGDLHGDLLALEAA